MMEEKRTRFMYATTNLVHQPRRRPSFPQNTFAVARVQYTVPVTLYYAPAPVQTAPQQGMSFGAFLAILATVAGGAVLFDPKASKEAKALAQMTLGVSGPFLLNQVFNLQAWPGQQN
jgi:hypothetical protein